MNFIIFKNLHMLQVLTVEGKVGVSLKVTPMEVQWKQFQGINEFINKINVDIE